MLSLCLRLEEDSRDIHFKLKGESKANSQCKRAHTHCDTHKNLIKAHTRSLSHKFYEFRWSLNQVY